MITAVIIGADVLSRFGEFTLDFKVKVQKSAKVGLCVQLKENPKKEWETGETRQAMTAVQVGAQEDIEMIVQASKKKRTGAG